MSSSQLYLALLLIVLAVLNFAPRSDAKLNVTRKFELSKMLVKARIMCLDKRLEEHPDETVQSYFCTEPPKIRTCVMESLEPIRKLSEKDLQDLWAFGPNARRKKNRLDYCEMPQYKREHKGKTINELMDQLQASEDHDFEAKDFIFYIYGGLYRHRVNKKPLPVATVETVPTGIIPGAGQQKPGGFEAQNQLQGKQGQQPGGKAQFPKLPKQLPPTGPKFQPLQPKQVLPATFKQQQNQFGGGVGQPKKQVPPPAGQPRQPKAVNPLQGGAGNKGYPSLPYPPPPQPNQPAEVVDPAAALQATGGENLPAGPPPPPPPPPAADLGATGEVADDTLSPQPNKPALQGSQKPSTANKLGPDLAKSSDATDFTEGPETGDNVIPDGQPDNPPNAADPANKQQLGSKPLTASDNNASNQPPLQKKPPQISKVQTPGQTLLPTADQKKFPANQPQQKGGQQQKQPKGSIPAPGKSDVNPNSVSPKKDPNETTGHKEEGTASASSPQLKLNNKIPPAPASKVDKNQLGLKSPQAKQAQGVKQEQQAGIAPRATLSEAGSLGQAGEGSDNSQVPLGPDASPPVPDAKADESNTEVEAEGAPAEGSDDLAVAITVVPLVAPLKPTNGGQKPKQANFPKAVVPANTAKGVQATNKAADLRKVDAPNKQAINSDGADNDAAVSTGIAAAKKDTPVGVPPKFPKRKEGDPKQAKSGQDGYAKQAKIVQPKKPLTPRQPIIKPPVPDLDAMTKDPHDQANKQDVPPQQLFSVQGASPKQPKRQPQKPQPARPVAAKSPQPDSTAAAPDPVMSALLPAEGDTPPADTNKETPAAPALLPPGGEQSVADGNGGGGGGVEDAAAVATTITTTTAPPAPAAVEEGDAGTGGGAPPGKKRHANLEQTKATIDGGAGHDSAHAADSHAGDTQNEY